MRGKHKESATKWFANGIGVRDERKFDIRRSSLQHVDSLLDVVDTLNDHQTGVGDREKCCPPSPRRGDHTPQTRAASEPSREKQKPHNRPSASTASALDSPLPYRKGQCPYTKNAIHLVSGSLGDGICSIETQRYRDCSATPAKTKRGTCSPKYSVILNDTERW